MKKLILILLAPLIFSCGGNSSENPDLGNVLENFTFSMDTVMIDSKGKLFDLRRGPNSSSISEDGKYLFLFNSNSRQIQQINLDELSWEKDFDFEVEGPNGITDMVLDTKTLGDGTFLISAYRRLGIFSDDGTKLKDISISSLPIATDLDELDYSIILSKDQKSLFSLPGTRFEGPRTFARINLESLEIENFKITEMDWISDLKVVFIGGYSYQEYLHTKEFKNEILILSPSTSAFYKYDLTSDSLTYHSFVHQLSPVKNTVQLKTKVESMEEYEEEMNRFNMSINFGVLMWDETRNLFFRFARKPIAMENSFQIGASQVFLYVYDPEFNLKGEVELNQLSKVPEDPFFKDGKLWSYVNVDDELGFAVMDFKF